ncbi:MAG: caspase family protein [Terracidiphilus sp.]
MLRPFCNRSAVLVGLISLSPFGLARCEGQASPAPSATSKPELVLQTGHTGQVGGLAFSPNKQLLASGGSDQITLWEVKTGRQLRTLTSGASGSTLPDEMMNRFAIAFSPNGLLLAQFSRGKVVIWDVQTGAVFRAIQVKDTAAAPDAAASSLFSRAGDLFGRMEFSPDGRVLAVPGTNLTLWDVSTGEKLRSFPLCESFAFSGTRQLLLLHYTLVGRTRAAFTDIDTGREEHGVDLTDRFFVSAMASIVRSPEGHWLAIGREKQSQALWDITSGNKPEVLPESSGFDITLQPKISPDGRFMALNTASGVTILDLPTRHVLHTLELPGRSGQPNAPEIALTTEFSADGSLLASTEWNGRLSVWDTSTWTKVADLYNHANLAHYLAFEQDGKHLVAGKTRWDLESGGATAFFPNSATSSGYIGSSGQLMADCDTKEGTIRVRDLATGNILHTLSVQSKVIPSGAVISPSGQLLAATYAPAEAPIAVQPSTNPENTKDRQKQEKDLFRQLEKGKLTLSELNERLNPVQILAEDEMTREVVIWDLASEHQIQALPLARGRSPVTMGGTAQFSADGTYLIFGGYEGSIQAWDVKSWKEISRITLGGNSQQGFFGLDGFDMNQIRSIEVSPDGRLVAAATSEEKMSIAPAEQLSQPTQPAKVPKFRPFAIGLPHIGSLPRGEDMSPATASDSVADKSPGITTSGPIEIFELKTGRRVADLPAHAGGAYCVAFSSDGKTLASGGANGEIKLWDVAGQKLIRTLAGDTSAAIALAFSPDGSILISSTTEGAVNLWDLEDGQKLVSMISLGDGSDWLQVTPDGLFDGSPAAWKEILWRFSGNTFDIAPVEMFFNEYFYPGLLSDLMAGRRPHAPAKLEDKDRRQPQLTLERADASGNAAAVTSRNLKLMVNVTAAPAGAQDVRLFRNGSLVKVWHGDVLQGRSSVNLEAEIPISAGENKLYAYAFNHDNVKSADATLNVAGAESLRRRGEVYVLAIGINQYANADYNLKFAVDDARAFGDVLRRNETSLQQFDRVEVVPIYDGDATKANILSAFSDLAAKAQPEDVVLVFIASHGTAYQGHFYLVPHDIGYSGSRTHLDSNALQTILNHSISDRDLEQAFEGLDAGRLLLVLDACNSGQALEAEEKRQGPMNSKGLAQLAYEKGMYILTASQSYQAAQEASELGHGLLTYALIEEGLEKGAADFEPKDGQISAREWLSYASKRVPEIQFDKIQQFRNLRRDFSFAEDTEGRRSQQPRLFYRRELEDSPWIIARH